VLLGDSQRARSGARASIARTPERWRRAESSRGEAADAAFARVQPTSIERFDGCGLVIRRSSDLDAKRSLFGFGGSRVRRLRIPPTPRAVYHRHGVGLQHGRVVGHFFNPAARMKLVEVISGLETSTEVAETVFATAQAWGKQAAYAKSTPGFIVNRIARPFYGEAWRSYTEGAADPATIDAIVRDCGGFPMGPFERWT
jgi:3-hydroxybutyryl-CoA dehydrogenase